MFSSKNMWYWMAGFAALGLGVWYYKRKKEAATASSSSPAFTGGGGTVYPYGGPVPLQPIIFSTGPMPATAAAVPGVSNVGTIGGGGTVGKPNPLQWWTTHLPSSRGGVMQGG